MNELTNYIIYLRIKLAYFLKVTYLCVHFQLMFHYITDQSPSQSLDKNEMHMIR